MKRIILLVLGFGALALGGIGLALPVLPTTPFVLCAAGCFGASSPALATKLENTRYFGEYIRNYKDKTGVSRRAKATGLVFLWGMLILSAVLVRSPAMAAVLAVVGTAVTTHILLLRSKKTTSSASPATLPEEMGTE